MSPRDTRHLSLGEVIALHEQVMERMGATPAPFRAGGEGLLESTVMRPRMAEYYEGADMIRQAALLAIGISQAQAFLDGNKRTAFAASRVFLRVNGYRQAAASLEMAKELEAVATRADSLEAATARFEAWLRADVKPAG
ncbi:MAG TPA: type II toxin-antitoxin system death-on-curing family toxin [Chloroflexota bacterium]|nr:type II toxin-antitoxin system death-on-curing family toxin [Chloroflexota bacterium]